MKIPQGYPCQSLLVMVEYGRALEWVQLQEDLQKAEFPMLGFQARDVQFQL